MSTPPTPTIPLHRTVKTRVEVLRRGDWVDVSRFLARAEVNHGDHTGVGVNPSGVDGVARTATITLKSSGSMRRYWPSTLSRLSTDLLGDSDERVAWSNEDASVILEWLFGPAAGWARENLAPRDRTSPVNLVEVDGDMVYDPLLWSNKEIRVWGRTLSGLTPQPEYIISGDGSTSEYDLPHALIEPETVRVVTDGADPIEWEIDGWTGHLWLSRPLAVDETLTVDYAIYSQDDGWKCDFHGVIGGDIAVNGTSVTVQVVDLSKRPQEAYILDPVETPYSGPMEDVMQAILDDHPSTVGITLYFPSGTPEEPRPSNESPEWFVETYAPAEMSVFDALGRLAARRGWFVGYRWHVPTEQMQLQLMEPARWKDESTADLRLSWMTDFYAHDLADSDSQIINYVEIVWRDENGDEHTTVRKNDASIAEYGLRAGRIREEDTEEIRDEEAAGRLGDAIIADMSEMRGASSLDIPLIPGMDVFTGIALDDPRVSSSEDFLGVENVFQLYDYEGGRFRTQVSGPNRVVGGLLRWIGMIARPGAKEPVSPESIGGAGARLPAPVSVLVSAINEGLSIYVPAPPVHSARWATTEVHVSTTQGFEPDESTLAASNRATRFEIAPLEAVTHYVLARYIDVDGKPGAWSAEVSDAPKEPFEPDLTPPDAPELGTLVPQALDLGSGRYDISVTVPFTVDERTVRVIVERREGTSGDWVEVGSVTSPPFVDRAGLKAPGTYQYRAWAESDVGVPSGMSDVETVNIPKPSIAPAPVESLDVDFSGPDCVISWPPVAGAVQYRVEIQDLSAQRREQFVAGTQYTYTFADNVSDGGGAPSPAISISVWAINAIGNQSPTPATKVAVNTTPAAPTIRLESSLTQLRWEVTSSLPRDWATTRVSVTGTSYSASIRASQGIIDLSQLGISDGSSVEVSVRIEDVFGQISSITSSNVDAIYATEQDLAGSIFQVEYKSDQFPSGADPAVLYDNDPTTGITFLQAPTIVVKHPQEERFGMVTLHVNSGVQGYVQVRRHGISTWTSVIGTPGSPYSFDSGENVVAFVGSRIVVAQEVRVVLLSPVRVNEFTPSVYLIANHILAGTMKLTGGMEIIGPDGNVVFNKDELRTTDAQGNYSSLNSGRLMFYDKQKGIQSFYINNMIAGTAQDGEIVDVSQYGWQGEPHVLVSPASVVAHDPINAPDGVSLECYADVFEDSFRVNIKARAKGTEQTGTTTGWFANTTGEVWRWDTPVGLDVTHIVIRTPFLVEPGGRYIEFIVEYSPYGQDDWTSIGKYKHVSPWLFPVEGTETSAASNLTPQRYEVRVRVLQVWDAQVRISSSRAVGASYLDSTNFSAHYVAFDGAVTNEEGD